MINYLLTEGVRFVSIQRVLVEKLESYFEDKIPDETYVGFADPCSSSEFLGWPLRNLLSLVCSRTSQKDISSKGINIIALRQNMHKKLQVDDCPISVADSLIVKVNLSAQVSPAEELFVIKGENYCLQRN